MSNNRQRGWQAASFLSAQAGKLAYLSLVGGGPLVGTIEDVRSPHGVNLSVFHIQAEGFALPIIPAEQPSRRLDLVISGETWADYFADPGRRDLAAAYADYCLRLQLPWDDYAALNVVHHLETKGVRARPGYTWAVVASQIAPVRESYYGFVNLLAQRLNPTLPL